MKTKLLILTALLSLPASAKVRVAATVSELGSIARAVGGPEVEVEVLANPGQDPHFVDAKPSLVLALARAELLLLDGMDLELGWLPTLLTSSRNANLQKGAPGYLDCSTLISPREVPTEKVDRSMGDIHPAGNPHYLRSPQSAIRVAHGIADRLSKIDPEDQDKYQAAAGRFEAELTGRMARWLKALEPHRGAAVVTYHRSWIYFLEWAGLREAGTIEPKPGIPPDPGHVARLLTTIREKKIPIILQERWYPSATSELLAQKSSVRVVKVAGSPAPTQSYFDYLDEVVTEVVKGLSASP